MTEFFTYVVHNTVNNKVYIGKSTKPFERFKKHLKVASGTRKVEKFYFHRAINKYGGDNFTFSILQKFDNEEDCNQAEMYWIKFFNAKNKKYGYNLTDGGEGCSGRVITEETREKMRKHALTRRHTEETKQKLREINLGKRLSKESIEKTRQARLGVPLSEEHKRKISESTKGKIKKKFTKEQVIEIRRLYEKENWSQRELADFFNAKQANISFITTYRTWSDLTSDNVENYYKKGTPKLKAADVIKIREMHSTGKYTYVQLAAEFSVSKRIVAKVIKRVTWKNV